MTGAGWRAIWVHPPACAGSAFDMASVDKATGAIPVEAEVDCVAEANRRMLVVVLGGYGKML